MNEEEKKPVPKASAATVGDLPPVNLKKSGNPNMMDIKAHAPKSSQEVDDLAKKADEIAKKNAEAAQDQPVQRGETLEERQARLKRQRELILAKKKQERQDSCC